jgi:hypothetical protein
MSARIAFLLVLATALCVGGNAWAWSSSKTGPQAAQAAANGIKSENGTVKTAVNQAYGGACTTGDYADYCGSGDCECFQFLGRMKTGATGPADVELDVTLEFGWSYLYMDGAGWIPGYADFYVNGKKDAQYWFGNVIANNMIKGKSPLYTGLVLDGSFNYVEGVATLSGAPKGNPNSAGTKLNLKLKGNVVLP